MGVEIHERDQVRRRRAAISSRVRPHVLTGCSPAAASHSFFSSSVTRMTICSSRRCSSGIGGLPVRATGRLYHPRKVLAATDLIEYTKYMSTITSAVINTGPIPVAVTVVQFPDAGVAEVATYIHENQLQVSVDQSMTHGTTVTVDDTDIYTVH